MSHILHESICILLAKGTSTEAKIRGEITERLFSS